MKLVILTVLLSTQVFAASEKKAPPPIVPPAPQLRYRQIQRPDGKVVATVDLKDGSIKYDEDPKEVVKLLIQIADSVVNQCNKQLSDMEKKNSKVKK